MNNKHFTEQLADYQNEVLDFVVARFHLKNDAALSHLLQIAPPVISKSRHKLLPIGPAMLVRILELTDLHISELHRIITVKQDAPSGTDRRHAEREIAIAPTTLDYIVTQRQQVK